MDTSRQSHRPSLLHSGQNISTLCFDHVLKDGGLDFAGQQQSSSQSFLVCNPCRWGVMRCRLRKLPICPGATGSAPSEASLFLSPGASGGKRRCEQEYLPALQASKDKSTPEHGRRGLLNPGGWIRKSMLQSRQSLFAELLFDICRGIRRQHTRDRGQRVRPRNLHLSKGTGARLHKPKTSCIESKQHSLPRRPRPLWAFAGGAHGFSGSVECGGSNL